MKTELTPEQIRVRCAEIEGWRNFEIGRFSKVMIGTSSEGEPMTYLPDYCNSIDAINAVVLRLPEVRQMDWTEAMIMQQGKWSYQYKHAKNLITASALDRARAFVQIHDKP